MHERKLKQKEARARARLSHQPSMVRALPAASTFGAYSPRAAMGTTAPWSQPGHHLFYSDVDEPSRFPGHQQSSAVFQRS